jgi:hypothetical protein
MLGTASVYVGSGCLSLGHSRHITQPAFLRTGPTRSDHLTCLGQCRYDAARRDTCRYSDDVYLDRSALRVCLRTTPTCYSEQFSAVDLPN